MKVGTRVAFIVFLVLLIDQAVKIWIKTTFEYGEEITVFPWFIIHFIENPGMAFGTQLHDIPILGKVLQPAVAKPLLTILRIVAVGFIIYVIRGMIRNVAPKGLLYSMGLILAGAIGNIIDSTFYGLIFNKGRTNDDALYRKAYEGLAEPNFEGYAPVFGGSVVDMLHFPLFTTTWPEWVPKVGGQTFTFFSPVFNIADASITIGVFLILIFQRAYFKKKTA
ncbi:MAG: lipoprotein signal peptidase [Saprospiraceae bacterium]|nr:lipoprotein signal peptidase [Saprospiraceae bacterium]